MSSAIAARHSWISGAARASGCSSPALCVSSSSATTGASWWPVGSTPAATERRQESAIGSRTSSGSPPRRSVAEPGDEALPGEAELLGSQRRRRSDVDRQPGLRAHLPPGSGQRRRTLRRSPLPEEERGYRSAPRNKPAYSQHVAILDLGRRRCRAMTTCSRARRRIVKSLPDVHRRRMGRRALGRDFRVGQPVHRPSLGGRSRAPAPRTSTPRSAPRVRAFDDGPWPRHDRRRARAAHAQARRPDRRERRADRGGRDDRQRQADPRDGGPAARAGRLLPLLRGRGRQDRRRDAARRPRRTSSSTRCASRSASSPRSRRGTRRCC